MAPSARPKLIVIAASTAGPPAVRQLLAELPAGFPVPVLLVQHTLEGMTSHLAEQLASQTRLTVREARTGETPEAGTMLIAPAGWHLELAAGEGGVARVTLHQGAKEQCLRPSADVLFRSAARLAGAGTLGIVLTGMGEDGLAGARAIVAAGGRVWAQDRASAVAPSMPGMIHESGLASFAGRPEELGRELQRVVLGPDATRSPIPLAPARPAAQPARASAARSEPRLLPESFRFVRDFLQRQAGIALAENKEYFAAVRLAALAEELGLEGVESLVASLRREPVGKLAERAVDELTINETSFFRDAVCFDLLIERLLPPLVARLRPLKRLRVWSAACSTGEEPYSVAMLLRTHFPELAAWKLELLATDISRRVLAKAAAGLYTAREIGRGLPRGLLERWFVAEDRHWRVCAAIRALVQFETLNLQKPFPPLEPFDLVFLRNVLIYFDDATKHDVLLRIAHLLRPGGILVLGSADALRDTRLPLRALHCEPLVAYVAT